MNEFSDEFNQLLITEFLGPDFAGIRPKARPLFQLRSLSIKMRWEVTRRHPHYQKLWKYSAAFHQNEPSSTDEFEQLRRDAAVKILAGIGVSGEPPNPAIPFSELGEDDLNKAWLSGAVHPITLRGMAGILLACLSQESLGQLGAYFLEALRDDPQSGRSGQKKSMEKLAKFKAEDLDCYPDEPFVSINPAASQRQISQAVNELLFQWKNERNLTEQRDRSDKNSEYMEIWDLREGWADEGSYDVKSEHLFKQIAEKNKKTISTISNQYRSAFELIIGEEYSRELWWQTMGICKVSTFDLPQKKGRLKRPMKSPSRRPVSETRLGVTVEFIKDNALNNEYIGDSISNYTKEDLALDIKELVEDGYNNNKILKKLEIGEKRSECLALIEWYRPRIDEF